MVETVRNGGGSYWKSRSTENTSASEEVEDEEDEGEEENGEEEKYKMKKGGTYVMGRNLLPPPSGFSELRRS